jgi:hypothetical protein
VTEAASATCATMSDVAERLRTARESESEAHYLASTMYKQTSTLMPALAMQATLRCYPCLTQK